MPCEQSVLAWQHGTQHSGTQHAARHQPMHLEARVPLAGAPLRCNWRLSGTDGRPRLSGILASLGHWLHKELPLAIQQQAMYHPASRIWDAPGNCLQWHQSG